MVEKPISGDEEQRRAQTRASREQSGLPPEDAGEESLQPKQQPVQREHKADVPPRKEPPRNDS